MEEKCELNDPNDSRIFEKKPEFLADFSGFSWNNRFIKIGRVLWGKLDENAYLTCVCVKIEKWH